MGRSAPKERQEEAVFPVLAANVLDEVTGEPIAFRLLSSLLAISQ